jgi:hypothetical protein
MAAAKGMRLRRCVIGVGLLTASVAVPLASAAPDEAAHGAMHGYSPGHRGNWFSQQHAVGAFMAMDTFFAVRPVHAIIPSAWVAAATSVRAADVFLQPGTATRYFGYGYQTWISPERLGFALIGVRGQAIYVHPRLKLVMVQTAVWPRSSDPALARQRDALWRELVRAAFTV